VNRTAAILGAGALALSAVSGCSGDGAEAGSKVCVNEYVTLPILEDAVDGIRSALEEEGYADGDEVEYDIRNPEGDASTQQTIASQFIGDSDCAVLVGLTTPGSQVFLQPNREAPLVFFASSAPLEAKLVDNLEKPGGDVTGVSDPLPVELELEAMIAIDPDVKTVGLVWKNGDASGDALAARAKAAADDLGIEVVEAPISNASDTTQSALSLVDRVDAIQVAGDGPTVSGVGGILKVAQEHDLPVFGGTTESVDQGALLAGAYDYGVLGEEAGRIIAQILDGEEAGEIPVYVPDETRMRINEDVLADLGLEVPDDLDVDLGPAG